MKAPLPPDEPFRLHTLEQYHIMDTLPEQSYDDLTFLASQICETPVAMLTLLDESRQWFKSRVGVDVQQMPREISFCAHAILTPQLMVIPDAAADERFADNPLVTDGPHVRFYAGAPLVTAEGTALGTLCVLDDTPRTLSESQQESLRALGRQVVAQMEMRRMINDMSVLLAAEARLLEIDGADLEDATAEEERGPG